MMTNHGAPWWVAYMFLSGYAVALTYGWLVVDKVPTSDYFTQMSLLLAAAFGIQMEPRGKKGSVEVTGEDVTVTEEPKKRKPKNPRRSSRSSSGSVSDA